MNIEILEEGYVVDEVIEQAKSLYKEQRYTSFKCKDRQKRDMNLEEIIIHLKECKARTNNLRYRNTPVIIIKVNNEEEIEETISLISQRIPGINKYGSKSS